MLFFERNIFAQPETRQKSAARGRGALSIANKIATP
jgi:hypothetical protein